MAVTYLITGSNGQLGREWIAWLEGQKISYKGFSSQELDITDHASVEKVIASVAPVYVINCAAYTKVDQAEDDFEMARKVNGEGVKNLAGACAENRVKLVNYSTDYVFAGKDADKKKFPRGYPEITPRNPLNKYGQSKAEGEQFLEASNCDWLNIRVAWLCGAYGGNFVKTMLKLGAERDELKVVDDQIGSPTFTADVVATTHDLLAKGAKGHVHVTSKGLISWYDLAKAAFEEAGVTVRVEPVHSEAFPTPAPRPKFSKLSTLTLEEEFGIKPTDWRKGLKKLIAQFN